jgi:hypothetical protein
MENPIQVSTPPPAIEKASSETPNTFSERSYDQDNQHGQRRLGGVGQSCCAGLTCLYLREHGPADQRIHQRKNRHNRLKVLFHLCVTTRFVQW